MRGEIKTGEIETAVDRSVVKTYLKTPFSGGRQKPIFDYFRCKDCKCKCWRGFIYYRGDVRVDALFGIPTGYGPSLASLRLRSGDYSEKGSPVRSRQGELSESRKTASLHCGYVRVTTLRKGHRLEPRKGNLTESPRVSCKTQYLDGTIGRYGPWNTPAHSGTGPHQMSLRPSV
jgi:hypothetical protein